LKPFGLEPRGFFIGLGQLIEFGRHHFLLDERGHSSAVFLTAADASLSNSSCFYLNSPRMRLGEIFCARIQESNKAAVKDFLGILSMSRGLVGFFDLQKLHL
jgi:hypothetical protein